jgi:cysteine-rich repeat protein
MRGGRRRFEVLFSFTLMLLGVSGCLSDHCEVYPQNCAEAAEEADSSDTSNTSDSSDTEDAEDTSDTDTSECGDGSVQAGEECDEGPDNGPGSSCTSQCMLNVCGDGELGPGEGCDDGNTVDDDECTNACALTSCGDGRVGPGEACDDGNAIDTDACTTVCTNSPETPVLELSFSQVEQFEFSWAPVLGAEYYQLLESADVGQDFVQVGGDIVGESVEVTMPLHFRLNASYQLLACNAEGCSESAVVDVVGGLAEAVGYFKASNSAAADWFGWRVALSGDGNTLAVGATHEGSSATGIGGDQADNAAGGAGAVYVFVRNGAVWSQQAYVKASNSGYNDSFGSSVALSDDGNTLVVGAISEQSRATGIGGNQADNSAYDAGAVYVFVRDGAIWSQQAYVKASNSGADDRFGYSLALSGDGNTLVVGALYEDSGATGIGGNQADNSTGDAGAVYVFVRNGAVWSQQAYVKASNPGTNDWFGLDVALSDDGNTLAVSGYAEDSQATGIDGNQADNSADGAGAIYVFVRNGVVWSQQAYVKASNSGSGDYFGSSVALSDDGNTLAVGASVEDSQATGIDGDQADNSVSGAGAVYVFVRNGAVWSQQAYVKASNSGSGDSFGNSVALAGDGNTLAVGASGEDSSATGIGGNQADNSAVNAGAVYVFVRSGAVWSQQAYVKASNSGSEDLFGHSMALSDDGTILTVSARGEASSAMGIGGDQADDSAVLAGAVYLY